MYRIIADKPSRLMILKEMCTNASEKIAKTYPNRIFFYKEAELALKDVYMNGSFGNIQQSGHPWLK